MNPLGGTCAGTARHDGPGIRMTTGSAADPCGPLLTARPRGGHERLAATQSGARRWMLFSNRWRCLWGEMQDLRSSNTSANAGKQRKRPGNANAANSERTSRLGQMSSRSSRKRVILGEERQCPTRRRGTPRREMPGLSVTQQENRDRCRLPAGPSGCRIRASMVRRQTRHGLRALWPRKAMAWTCCPPHAIV